MKYCVCGHGEDAHAEGMGCAVCECGKFIEYADDYDESMSGDDDVCTCGHNIHEHEAVGDCKCYAYGCNCQGFEAK